MPTFLGQPFSPYWEGKPPGMAPRDSALWVRFMDKHKDDIIRIYYNVRVGGGSLPRESNDPDDILSWMMLTMFRIDAVAEYKDHVLLCEIRPNAGRSLYGALMIYNQLWATDPKIDKPFSPLGITDYATTQVHSIFELNDLGLEIV